MKNIYQDYHNKIHIIINEMIVIDLLRMVLALFDNNNIKSIMLCFNSFDNSVNKL